jgi:hypothetical protein
LACGLGLKESSRPKSVAGEDRERLRKEFGQICEQFRLSHNSFFGHLQKGHGVAFADIEGEAKIRTLSLRRFRLGGR